MAFSGALRPSGRRTGRVAHGTTAPFAAHPREIRRMASLSSVRHWHEETDVLVCGFGLAGAAAAIEAHDLDPAADVLVI